MRLSKCNSQTKFVGLRFLVFFVFFVSFVCVLSYVVLAVGLYLSKYGVNYAIIYGLLCFVWSDSTECCFIKVCCHSRVFFYVLLSPQGSGNKTLENITAQYVFWWVWGFGVFFIVFLVFCCCFSLCCCRCWRQFVKIRCKSCSFEWMIVFCLITFNSQLFHRRLAVI